MRARFSAAIAAGFGLLISCSAPARMPELAEAEAAERAGRDDEALDAYARAQKSCADTDDLRLRYQRCSTAFLSRAELLDRMGRRSEAADAYAAIPALLPDHRAASAEATYRAGRIHLELGAEVQGYAFLWKTVTDYPDEEFAADALKILLADGRKRDPRQLYDDMGKVARSYPDSAAADNLLYHMADLAEHELGQPDQAVSLYDAIAQRHSAGGLIDDALWHGARVAHQLGDAEGAVKRLRHLASIREVAFGTGSYLSIWHDDGQLRLGIILRDDLRRPLEAAAELRKLHELYPASILRDDARYEEAVALSMAGKPREACAALTALHDRSPDSKYELDKAPTLRRELGCRPPI